MDLDRHYKLNSYLALIFGSLIIIGETYRRYGEWGHWSRWLDDFIIGLFLIVPAILIVKGHKYGRKLIIGGWGFSSGLLYGSFFSKVTDVNNIGQSNIDSTVLICLIGLAFITASLSLIWLMFIEKSTSK